jgi:hypothetical protein
MDRSGDPIRNGVRWGGCFRVVERKRSVV